MTHRRHAMSVPRLAAVAARTPRTGGTGMAGFTLIEVMVAMLLMGLLAVMSYRGLDAVLQAEAHARVELERWRAVDSAFRRIDNDLLNALGVADASGRRGFRIDADGAGVAWDRLLPADEEGGVRRVGYAFRAGSLRRLVWREAAPAGEAAQETPLLDGVRAVSLRCMDARGVWQGGWPAAGQETELPRALEWRLTLADGVELRRVMKVQ